MAKICLVPAQEMLLYWQHNAERSCWRVSCSCSSDKKPCSLTSENSFFLLWWLAFSEDSLHFSSMHFWGGSFLLDFPQLLPIRKLSTQFNELTLIQARNEGQITIFCIWKASCRDNLGYIVGNPFGTFTAVLLGQKAKRGVGAVHTECMLGCCGLFFRRTYVWM